MRNTLALVVGLATVVGALGRSPPAAIASLNRLSSPSSRCNSAVAAGVSLAGSMSRLTARPMAASMTAGFKSESRRVARMAASASTIGTVWEFGQIADPFRWCAEQWVREYSTGLTALAWRCCNCR
jgi:hypothetical protein